jgi:hypothetical protein
MPANRLDGCGRCELLPTTTGWVRATQVRCPVHGSRPDALPAEIPEPLMLDLLRHVDDSDGLDVAEDELLHHRRTRGYIWAIKAAWAAGRTAAAADLEALRVKRAETACCGGTGHCGDRECQIDSAVDSALAFAAARIAEGTETDG